MLKNSTTEQLKTDSQTSDVSSGTHIFDILGVKTPNDYSFLDNTIPLETPESAPYSGVKTPEQQEQEEATGKVGTEEELPPNPIDTIDNPAETATNPENWIGDNDPAVFEGRPELEKAHQEYAGDALFRLPVYGVAKTYLNIAEAGLQTADFLLGGALNSDKINLEDALLSDTMKDWIKPHTAEMQKMAPIVSVIYGSYLMGRLAGGAIGKLPIGPKAQQVFSNALSYFINTDMAETNTNMINTVIDTFPQLKDTILDYLAYDKSDSGLERRLKSVGYNLVLDGALNFFLVKPIKAAWRWQHARDEKAWLKQMAARADEIDEDVIMAAAFPSPPQSKLSDYIDLAEQMKVDRGTVSNAKWLKEADDELASFLQLNSNMTDKDVVDYFANVGSKAEIDLRNSMRIQADIIKKHMLPNTTMAFTNWQLAMMGKAPNVNDFKDAYVKELSHLLYGIDQMGATVGRSGRLLQFVKTLDSSLKTIDPIKGLDSAADQVSDGLVKMITSAFADDAALIELGNSIQTLGMAGTSVGAISAFVNQTVKQAVQPMKWYEVIGQKLKFYYYNALLSGPRTVIRNVVGEGTSVYGTRGLDVMFEGLWRGHGFQGARDRAAAYYRGMASGWEKQKEIFWASLKTGNPVVDGLVTFSGQERKAIHMMNSPKNLYEKIMGSPTRLNTASDQALGYAARLGHLEVQFYDFMHANKVREKIWNAGMAGNNTRSSEYLEMLRRQWMNTANPFRDVAVAPGQVLTQAAASNTVNTAFGIDMVKANQLALRDLAKQDMGKITQGIKQVVDAIPGGFILVPFLSTPTNLMKNTLYYHGPLGILRLLNHTTDANARAQILGEVSTGLVLWGTAFAAVMSGKIIGSGPMSRAGREAWQAQGIIPASIHIGNTYVSLNDIGPAADPFIIMANLVDNWRKVDKDDPFSNKDLLDLARDTANAMISFAADKSYLKTVGNVVDALQDERSLKRLAMSTVGGFVPAFLSTARQMIDPNQRQVGTRDRGFGSNTFEEFANTILNRLPFGSYTLPEKFSWLNGMPAELPYSGGFGPHVQPMFWNMTKGKNEREVVATTLAKMRNINAPTQDNAFGFNVDDQTYAEFCREMGTLRLNGKTVYEAIEQLIKSPNFARLGPDPSVGSLNPNKEREINKILLEYRQAAAQRYMGSHPDLTKFYMRLNTWENQMKTNTPPTEPRPVYDRLMTLF